MAQGKNRQRQLADLIRVVRNDSDNNDSLSRFQPDVDVVGGRKVYLGGGLSYDSDAVDSSGRLDTAAIKIITREEDAVYANPVFERGTYGGSDSERNLAIKISADMYMDSDVEFFAPEQIHVVSTRDDSDRLDYIISDDWDGGVRRLIGGRNNTFEYHVRSGEHFDSDYTRVHVDTLLRQSRVIRELLGSRMISTPGESGYNVPVQRMASEMAVGDLFDVAHNGDDLIGARVGDVLTWNGMRWTPDIASIRSRYSLRVESAEIPSAAHTVSFSNQFNNPYLLLFYNGHLLSRDSESIVTDESRYFSRTFVPTDSDIDYRIIPRSVGISPDGIVYPEGDILEFGEANGIATPLAPGAAVSLIYHQNQRVRFYKSFYVPEEHYTGVPSEDSDARQFIRIHDGIGVSSFDEYSTSSIHDRKGTLLVFMSGMLLRDSEDYIFDDSDTVSFTEQLAGNDEIQFVWLQSERESGIELRVETQIATTGGTDFTFSILNDPDFLQPEDTLVFIDGHLINNNPVVEYEITGSTLSFLDPVDSEAIIQLVNVTGPDSSTSQATLGDLTNTATRVDNAALEGEPLVWNGSIWDTLYSTGVANHPGNVAWLRCNIDSSTTPDPRVDSDSIYEYGFDSDQIHSGATRLDDGDYVFRLNTETFDRGSWHPDHMSVVANVYDSDTSDAVFNTQITTFADSDRAPIEVRLRVRNVRTGPPVSIDLDDPSQIHIQVSGSKS